MLETETFERREKQLVIFQSSTSSQAWRTGSVKGRLTCSYRMRLAVVAPFAIIWFCDAKNVSHILPDYSNEVQMGLCKSTVHIANPCSA